MDGAITDADAKHISKAHAFQYRDGLIIAFLALIPVRSRTLVAKYRQSSRENRRPLGPRPRHVDALAGFIMRRSRRSQRQRCRYSASAHLSGAWRRSRSIPAMAPAAMAQPYSGAAASSIGGSRRIISGVGLREFTEGWRADDRMTTEIAGVVTKLRDKNRETRLPLAYALNSFFVEGGAMNFIEKSAIATNRANGCSRNIDA